MNVLELLCYNVVIMAEATDIYVNGIDICDHYAEEGMPKTYDSGDLVDYISFHIDDHLAADIQSLEELEIALEWERFKVLQGTEQDDGDIAPGRYNGRNADDVFSLITMLDKEAK